MQNMYPELNTGVKTRERFLKLMEEGRQDFPEEMCENRERGMEKKKQKKGKCKLKHYRTR